MASAINVLDNVHPRRRRRTMHGTLLFDHCGDAWDGGAALESRGGRGEGLGPASFAEHGRRSFSGFGHRFHPIDPRSPRLLELVDAAAVTGMVVSGRFLGNRPPELRRFMGTPQGTQDPDEHRRGHGRYLLGTGVFVGARARSVHSIPFGRHPCPCLGAIAAGRPGSRGRCRRAYPMHTPASPRETLPVDQSPFQ